MKNRKKELNLNSETNEYPWDSVDRLPPEGEIRKYPLVPIEWKFQHGYAMQDLLRAQEKILELEAEIIKLKKER